jgi:hypothetical protein
MTFRSANDLDTQRLDVLEELCHAKVYTCSIQDSHHERHINCSLTNRKLRNEFHSKWENVRFDQVTFDWRNMPDRYLKNNIRSVWIYKTLLALTKDMLQTDGTVYLPFIMTYYAAVASHMDELTSCYDIEFCYEQDTRALEKADLVRASNKMGISNLAEYTKISISHIKTYDLGTHADSVLEHYLTLEDPEDIRLIQLQWKNKVSKT